MQISTSLSLSLSSRILTVLLGLRYFYLNLQRRRALTTSAAADVDCRLPLRQKFQLAGFLAFGLLDAIVFVVTGLTPNVGTPDELIHDLGLAVFVSAFVFRYASIIIIKSAKHSK